MEIKRIELEIPHDCNIILGMAHFIKTVEDLYESLITSAPNIKFGIGFCESSGPCLVRHAGNDKILEDTAAKNSFNLSVGHSFLILLKDVYPINVLSRVKSVQEICSIYCATANPVEVLIIESKQGRGIIGVIDGYKPKGIENDEDIKERKTLLRKIGYKI
jgi:adenosine/AMP kinase